MWSRSNLHSRPEISGDPYYLCPEHCAAIAAAPAAKRPPAREPVSVEGAARPTRSRRSRPERQTRRSDCHRSARASGETQRQQRSRCICSRLATELPQPFVLARYPGGRWSVADGVSPKSARYARRSARNARNRIVWRFGHCRLDGGALPQRPPRQMHSAQQQVSFGAHPQVLLTAAPQCPIRHPDRLANSREISGSSGFSSSILRNRRMISSCRRCATLSSPTSPSARQPIIASISACSSPRAASGSAIISGASTASPRPPHAAAGALPSLLVRE